MISFIPLKFNKLKDIWRVCYDKWSEIDISEKDIPEVKLKKWGDEAFVKITYPDFHPVNPKQEGDKLKWQNSNKEVHLQSFKKEQSSIINSNILRSISLKDVKSEERLAFWESPGKINYGAPTLISVNPNKEFLGLPGRLMIDTYIKTEELPADIDISRLYGHSKGAGALLQEPSVLLFHLIYPKSWDVRLAKRKVRESILEICQENGIKVKAPEDTNDIYFKNGDKWKKFSGQLSFGWPDWNVSVTTMSFDFDGDLADKIYKLDSEKFIKKGNIESIKDIVGGLHEVNPNLNPDEIKPLVIERISTKLGLSLENSSFTTNENDKIEELRLNIEKNKDKWINEAEREDFITSEGYEKTPKFEYNIILKEKPITNKIIFNLEIKGLKFYYQPPLTQQEKDKGAFRPANVIGSYAVYRDTKPVYPNKEEAEKYKTGKAFHIYRPQIEDANGWKVWGEINIDEEKGTLTVAIPQEFLDNAVYPIYNAAGLEFGYNDAGDSAQSIAVGGTASVRLGSDDAPASTGTLDSMHASLSGDLVTDCKAFINEKDSVAANSHGQIATKENLACATAKHWEEFTLSDENITASTTYIFNVIGNVDDVGKGEFYYVYYDVVDARNNYNESQTYATPESPWTDTPSSEAVRYSIYATYTATAATTRRRVIISGAKKIFRLLVIIPLLGLIGCNVQKEEIKEPEIKQEQVGKQLIGGELMLGGGDELNNIETGKKRIRVQIRN